MRVSVAVAVAVALCGLITGCDRSQITATQYEKSSQGDEPDSLIKELAADPQFVWFSTLQRLYPSDYAVAREALRNQITDSDSIVSARVAMADAMRPIMARHKEAAKLASDRELVEYLRRNTRVAEALASEDTKACTDVFQGHLDPRIELPDATWKLMSEATAQLLVAAHDGEITRTQRGDSGLSQEDFAAWRVTMEKAGANADTFDLISNPVRKATATAEEKCRVRIQMMKGALNLLQPLAAKITLNMLG